MTAGVVAPLFFRLRVSPVLGYLLAGVALGPYGLGSLGRRAPWLSAFAINVEAIDRIAAFGVVALLFAMGLELSFERLRRMRRLVFGLGLAQVVVTTLILSALAWGLGLAPPSALTIGAALTMSSTAIVMPVLVESKRLHSAAGRASFSVLLFQDLAVAPLLVMTSAFAAGSGRGLGSELLGALIPAALGLAALVVFGRLALRPFFHFVAETKSPEFFMAACLLGGAGRWAGRRSEPPLDGARRFRRRAFAGGDRISPRDRSDHRAVQGSVARALFRVRRRRDQSRLHHRATRPHPRPCRGPGRAQGSDCFWRWRADSVCRRASPRKWRCCSGRAASSAS